MSIEFRRDLAAGEDVVVTPRSSNSRLTVITAAGATGTISRVDEPDASADSADTTSVAASSVEIIDVDWPHYRVSVAGGACRVAVMGP